MTGETDHLELASADQLSAEWLTSVLRAHGWLNRGERVVGFGTEPLGTGQMADTLGISLTTDQDQLARRSIVAKFSSTDEASRSTGLMSRAYETGAGFYS